MPKMPCSFLLSLLCAFSLAGCKEKPTAPASGPDATAAGSPAPEAQPASPEAIKKYALFLKQLATRIEGDFVAMAEQKFVTQADAFLAMAAVAPTGAKMNGHIEAVLKEVGLTREQVAGLVKEPGDEVREHASTFTRTVETAAMAFANAHRARIEALPKGDVPAAMAKATADAKGSDGLWILPQPKSPLATWTRVSNPDELRAQVNDAVAQSQPVVIHFTADWSTASKMTETVMLNHDGMRRILFGYRRLYIDVTGRKETDAAMQLVLATPELPRTMFFKDARPLAGFLGGNGTMPKPSMETGGPQKPQRFAKQLSEAK